MSDEATTIMMTGLGLLGLLAGGFLGYRVVDKLLTRGVYDTSNASELLKAGRVEEWNAFRIINRDWRPDLKQADFSNAFLPAVDLTRANLSEANFRNAKLDDANCSGSTLRNADFTDASLRRAAFDEADTKDAKFDNAIGTERLSNDANLQGPTLPAGTMEEISDDDLIAKIKNNPDTLVHLNPSRFESLIADVLSRLGYRIDRSSASYDRGYDMRAIQSDPIEGERIYLVECKSYGSGKPVGLAPVRAAYEVKRQEEADELMIITNSSFTSGAKRVATDLTDLILVDRDRLLQWIRRL